MLFFPFSSTPTMYHPPSLFANEAIDFAISLLLSILLLYSNVQPSETSFSIKVLKSSYFN